MNEINVGSGQIRRVRKMQNFGQAGTAKMRLELSHFCIPSTSELKHWVESQILPLQASLLIEKSTIRLARHDGDSPPYRVDAHLVTPGPDVFAAGSDHTLEAAMRKAMRQLRAEIARRARRAAQRTRSNLSEPAAKARGNRTF